MKIGSFIRCHVNMYEYFQAVTTILVCGNLKAGVVKHPKAGEIILTADYEVLWQPLYDSHNAMPAGVKKLSKSLQWRVQ